jgi:intracellular septation protein
VAFNYPTPTWVNFKVFVMTGLLLVFVVVQAFYLSRYMPDEAASPGAPSERP